MKLKPIVADLYQLYSAGLSTLLQAAVLIQVGRTGLHGITVVDLAHALEASESTTYGALNTLCEMKYVTRYTRRACRGRAHHYVCSVKGWELLTRPVDYSLYPDALKAIC